MAFDIKAHAEAIQAALAADEITSYWLDVPDNEPTYPYALLWGPLSGLHEEQTSAIDDAFSTLVYITWVTEYAPALLEFVPRGQAALEAGITVAGYGAELTYQRSEIADVDRTVTIPGTNRNPVFAVDVYRLDSSPERQP